MVKKKMGAGSGAARRVSPSREKILSAARFVLVDQGWDHASVVRIAAAAGVSVGSVYNRFQDRDALLMAALTEYAMEMSEELRRISAVDASLPLEEFLMQLTRVGQKFLVNHRDEARVFVARAAADERVDALQNTIRQSSEDQVTQQIVAHPEVKSGGPSERAIRFIHRLALQTEHRPLVSQGTDQDQPRGDEYAVLMIAYLKHLDLLLPPRQTAKSGD